MRSADEDKDQTYFLSGVSSEALSKVIFPVGNMKKVLNIHLLMYLIPPFEDTS